MRHCAVGTAGLAALLLAGCGANHNSIYRYKAVTAPETVSALVTIDAKQRAIIWQNNKVCTEPPPDVFSVYAQAFGASGSVSKSADPASLGVAASLSYAGSEQGATIARTQALNLLALQAYYNCLTSLNKDSNPLEVPIDRVRLQRLIISTLAIEQLTGALRPPTIVIGATGTASTGSADAVTALDGAWKASQAAATKRAEKQKAFDDLAAAAPKCDDVDAKVKAGTATEDEKKKQGQCKTAKDVAASTKDEHEAADKHYKALLAANGGGAPTGATTNAVDPKIVEAARLDPQAVANVTDAVETIVKEITGQDETKLFCIKVLGDDANKDIGLRENCVKLLSANVVQETDALVYGRMSAAERDRFNAETDATRKIDDAAAAVQFGAYWALVRDAASGVPDKAKVATRIDPIVKASIPRDAALLQQLKDSGDPAAAFQAFKALPYSTRDKLGK